MEEWLDLPEFADKVHELIDLGLFEEAQQQLDEYKSAYPNEPEMLLLYSRLYSEQNRPRQALEYLQQCYKIDRSNVDCLLGFFYAYSQIREHKKASAYLTEAEKLQPDNELVISSLIWYHNEQNRYEKAIAYFNKARQLHTNNPETFRNAGIAYERLGRYDEAEVCLRTAITLSPQYDEARDMLADLYIMDGRPEKAVELYAEYLKDSPRNIKVLSRLVYCLTQNDEYAEAAKQAQKTISLYPNSPVGYVDLAYVHLNKDEFDNALQVIGKALDVAPLDAEAWRVKGIVFSEKGEKEEAEKAFNQALSLDPENPEIMRDLYHHLRNAGDYERMEKIVDQVIRLEHPYCMEDFWFLADHYREQGQNLRAFHYLRKAYELVPGEAELIPPMVDIMLEEGHLSYTTPFLMHYVQRSGWNEVMDQFARHKRLQGKWAQEGLRLLRFFGANPSEFRRYIYSYYFNRFLRLIAGAAALIVVCAIYCFFGYKGFIAALSLAAGIGAAWLLRLFIKRLLRGRMEKTDRLL
jgi:tetratricopeptide (TPR) repeat protein